MYFDAWLGFYSSGILSSSIGLKPISTKLELFSAMLKNYVKTLNHRKFGQIINSVYSKMQ